MFETFKAALTMRNLYVFVAFLVVLIAWRVIRHFQLKSRRVILPDGSASPEIKAGNGSFLGGVMVTIFLLASLAAIAIIGGAFSQVVDIIAIIGVFLLFLVLWLPVIGVILWKTGVLENWFFEVETGNVGFVDAGENNIYIYPNVPHKILRRKGTIDGIEYESKELMLVDEEEEGQWEDEKTWLQKRFGLYWVGPGFLNRRVHLIPITKKKAVAEILPDMKPELWITGSDDVVKVNQLRAYFPRPVSVPDLKFKDAVEANLLLLGNFQIVVPRHPVYSLKGDFFDTLVNYVRSAMKDVGMSIDSDTFRVSGQVEGGKMSEDVRTLINRILINTCGVILKGTSIPVYNLSSDAEEKAAKQAKLEEQLGKARLTKQNFDNQVLVSAAKAKAEADRITGAASVVDVTTLADHFDSLGASPDVAAASATALGRASRYTKPGSPVTTQVEGGGANLAIQPSSESRRPKIEITDAEVRPPKARRPVK